MSIFRSNFSRLHAYRSIHCIIYISCKIFQHINPLCCLIFSEISFKTCLECPIPPFNNRSLNYNKHSDQATCSYFCSPRHGENLHLIFFNQYFSYEGIFSSELIPFIRREHSWWMEKIRKNWIKGFRWLFCCFEFKWSSIGKSRKCINHDQNILKALILPWVLSVINQICHHWMIHIWYNHLPSLEMLPSWLVHA